MAELTIEGLAAKVEELVTTNNELKKTVGDLTEENKALKGNVQELQEAHEQTGKILKTLSATAPVDIKPEKAEKLQVPTKTVTVGGKKYAFATAQVRVPGEGIVKTAAIVESPEDYTELLKKWVDSKSGLLKEVKE